MSLKSHFLSALEGTNRLHPPVWLMRQAGRYLPEYRTLRERHTFLDLCYDAELITKVTLLPIRRYPLDAAIFFADILLPLKALNIPFHFEEKIGPVVENNLDFDHLPTVDAAHYKHQFSFQTQAIHALKKELKVPLIGFAGAPFTLAAYILEGGSSHHFEKTKLFAYNHPKKFAALLDVLADLVRQTLLHQIDAGVDAVQVFDTHLNQLSPFEVRHFILPVLKKVFHKLPVPAILFAKGSHAALLSEVKPTALSVDWTIDMRRLRSEFPTMPLQGNLDPVVLLSGKENIVKQTKHLIEALPNDPAYIFNLGHGILPGTPPESVDVLLDTIHSCYPAAL